MPTVPSYKTELRFFHRGNLEGSLLTTEVFFSFSSFSQGFNCCYPDALEPVASRRSVLPERNSNPFLVPLSLTDSTDPEQFFLFRKHAAKPPSVQGAAVGQPDEVLHDDERRRRRPGAQDRLGYAEEESGHDVCCDVSFSFCARRSVAGDIGRRAAPTSSIVFFLVCAATCSVAAMWSNSVITEGSAASVRGLAIDLNFLLVDWAYWATPFD